MFKIIKYPLAYIRLLMMILTIFVFIIPGYMYHMIRPLNLDQKFRLRRTCLAVVQFFWGLRVQHFGSDFILDHKGLLIISNHRSFIDPFVHFRWLKMLPLSKAEVKHYPILAQGAELTGIIYIERTDKTSRSHTRKAIGEALSQGINVFLYPEGTTKGAVHTSDFKKGSIEEAISAGASIIPVVIEYKDKQDYWTDRSQLNQLVYQLGKFRSDIGLWVGKPMFYENPQEFIRQLRRVMDAAIDEMNAYWEER